MIAWACERCGGPMVLLVLDYDESGNEVVGLVCQGRGCAQEGAW